MKTELPYLVETLSSRDSGAAYEAMKNIRAISLEDDSAYAYMDHYFELLDCASSYLRSRGLILVAANAKWDKENKINSNIDKYLRHISDPKPITARQCIKLLPEIAKYKPELIDAITSRLQHADISIYDESMVPLICKDIEVCLSKIITLK